MALLDFRLQDSHGAYPSGLDTQELREQNYGLIQAARESNLLNGVNVEAIRNKWGVPNFKIPVLQRDRPTVTDGAMDCNFTGVELTGELLDVTFIQGWVPVELAYREGSSLSLSNAQIFARGFRNAELAIYDKIEEEIYTVLDNAKAANYNSNFVGTGNRFPLATNTMQVSDSQMQFFFNFAKSIMAADDFAQSGLKVVANTSMAAFINQYGNQGGANNTNSQFQFNGYDFKYSNFIPNTAAVSAEATGFIMPSDSLSMISQVSPEAQANGGQGYTSNNKSWMTYNSDVLGLELEVMKEDTCADVSAKTGNALDVGGALERWKLGYKIAILSPYYKNTNSGIKKFDKLPA